MGEPGWQEWVRGWGPGAMGCCGAGVLGRVCAEMRGCRGDGARWGCSGVLGCCWAGVLRCWGTGCRGAGVVGCGSTGVLGHWGDGVMGCRGIGVPWSGGAGVMGWGGFAVLGARVRG